MKKIELKGLDQDLYYEKLENGLEVYLVPYQNKKNYSVHYVTRYGSNDTSFTVDGKKVRVPDGIAHFLEHKMFEQEDGVDPFSFYAKTGTDCNASTSWTSTQYLFEGTSNLEENLDYLLTYVNSPYFTDENVEKEKGIIAEEIKMYDDEAMWVLERKMKEATFLNDPIRVDIAGTVNSIYQITKEDLYTCYQTFYQPNNIFLIVTGLFDPEKVLDVVKNNEELKKRDNKVSFTRNEFTEPIEVVTKWQEIELNVANQKVGLTIKLPWKEGVDHFTFDLYCGAILTMLFGISSKLSEEIRNKKYATSFYYMREHTKDYMTINFVAQSDRPKEFVDFILDNLEHAPLEKEDLERIKKVWVSSEVMMVDNINATLSNLYYDLIEFGRIIPEKVELIRMIDYDQLKNLRKSLDFTHHSVVVAKPKSEKIAKK